MPWDVDAAIKRLQEHAGPPYGVGKCAAYVREAIEAGGVHVPMIGSGSAKDYGPRLTRSGFVVQVGTVGFYQKGDVALIDGFSADPAKGIAKGSSDGHLAMFDGKIWISDFKQTGSSPYPGSNYRKAAPSITIYRHP